jgi:putative transposase
LLGLISSLLRYRRTLNPRKSKPDARAWEQRPLDDVYPVVFLDALVLKIREGGSVQRRACYLALGVGVDGARDVLGMWFQETEGAKFWMQVLSELKQRGVQP